jgi:hypothetical protein
MLTKTTYLTYTQCAKAFWLKAYQPNLATPPDPSSQRRLRAGQEVDKQARAQFPDGRLIPLWGGVWSSTGFSELEVRYGKPFWLCPARKTTK